MASREAIEKCVREYIATEIGYTGEIAPDEALVEGGIIDSFALIAFALFLQETYSFSVNPGDLTAESFSTLSSVVDFVEQRTQG